MIIIGHPAIPHQHFVKITNIADIQNTHSSNIVWFDTSKLKKEQGFILGKYCYEHKVNYAVMICSIDELLIYANLWFVVFVVVFVVCLCLYSFFWPSLPEIQFWIQSVNHSQV